MPIIEDEIMYPDYKNCIANLPNSILKRFGIKTAGETLVIITADHGHIDTKGAHAGMLKDEMLIPLIIIEQ